MARTRYVGMVVAALCLSVAMASAQASRSAVTSIMIKATERLLALSDTRREAEMDETLSAFARHASPNDLLIVATVAATLAPWRGQRIGVIIPPSPWGLNARPEVVIAVATGRDITRFTHQERERAVAVYSRALSLIRRVEAERRTAQFVLQAAKDRGLEAFLALAPPEERPPPVAVPRPHVPLLLAPPTIVPSPPAPPTWRPPIIGTSPYVPPLLLWPARWKPFPIAPVPQVPPDLKASPQ